MQSEEALETSLGTSRRIRMQGAEATMFEGFVRTYGVSDGVQHILGRAFDVHAGYADEGLATGVVPISVLLSALLRGTEAQERFMQRSLPAAVAQRLELSPEKIDSLWTSYLSDLPRSQQAVALGPSQELIAVMEAARQLSVKLSGGKTFALRHLFGALLEHFKTVDTGVIEKLDIDLAAIEQVYREHLTSYADEDAAHIASLDRERSGRERRIGGRLDTSREASDDQLCLNVHDYAAVLAKLFSEADDKEFCFAVYGRWGRGKTVLLDRVRRAIEQLKPSYRTIRFSAWKYPSTPEVWVYLYEEFAKVAFGGGWWGSLPNIFRTGVAKHGIVTPLLAYAMFALSMIPLGTAVTAALGTFAALLPIAGLAGFIWLISVWRGVSRTTARLSKDYLSATRHTEKLGLQATIGADLQALLQGWVQSPGFGKRALWVYWLTTAVLIYGTWRRLTAAPVLGLTVASSQTFAIAATAILLIVAMVVIAWLTSGRSTVSRVLLVIDDLDRCKPEHLLSVMESIKLLIEDPEISCRVQVVMLVEEDVLRRAILMKYRALMRSGRASGSAPFDDPQYLVAESLEKLFTAHLRLPPLSKPELRELIERFSGRRAALLKEVEALEATKTSLEQRANRQPIDRVAAGRKKVLVQTGMVKGIETYKERDEPDFRPATDEERRKDAHAIEAFRQKATPMIESMDQAVRLIRQFLGDRQDSSPAASEANPARTLEDDEVDAIQAAMEESSQIRNHLGPRAVRAFLFRYQLARLLLDKLQVTWNENDLARALVARSLILSKPTETRPVSIQLSDSEKIARIVEQVS